MRPNSSSAPRYLCDLGHLGLSAPHFAPLQKGSTAVIRGVEMCTGIWSGTRHLVSITSLSTVVTNLVVESVRYKISGNELMEIDIPEGVG